MAAWVLAAAVAAPVWGQASGTTAAAPPAPIPAAEPAKPVPTLKAGDTAPPLRVETFLKGAPVEAFKPGHIYVLEFWATWCGPCIAAMPHLSELHAQYKDRDVHVIGVNIWEDQAYSEKTLPKVRSFLEKRPSLMTYAVAYDGAAKGADTAWMAAAGRTVIPTTFVVDKAGKVAWIGHPGELDPVLESVLAGDWDAVEGPKKLKAAREAAQAACKKYAESLDAGEAAWAEATRGKPWLAKRYLGLRYSEMIAAGHFERGYALGRTIFESAKAAGDAVAMMGAVTPMIDPQINPKTIDRALAQEVATAVFALGDPAEPNRHIQVFQIYLLLGDSAACAKHRAEAERLIPAERRESLVRWLDQLEADAAKRGG